MLSCDNLVTSEFNFNKDEKGSILIDYIKITTRN